MRFYGHIAFGLFFSGLLGIKFDWLSILFAVIGSLLPDIDYPGSLVGKLFPSVSNALYKSVGHRSVTHSVYIAIGLMIMSLFVYQDNYLLYALTLGYISHLITDMSTPSGVQLTPPLRVSYTIFDGDVRNGSTKELLLTIVFIAGFILLLFFRNELYSLIT